MLKLSLWRNRFKLFIWTKMKKFFSLSFRLSTLFITHFYWRCFALNVSGPDSIDLSKLHLQFKLNILLRCTASLLLYSICYWLVARDSKADRWYRVLEQRRYYHGPTSVQFTVQLYSVHLLFFKCQVKGTGLMARSLFIGLTLTTALLVLIR